MFLYLWKYRNMDTKNAVIILASLAQGARLEIFRQLVQAGPIGLAAGDIAFKLNIPGSTLSFHLKELTHAELVTAKQTGRYIYYAAAFNVMNDLLGYLTENCCQLEKSSSENLCCDGLLCNEIAS